MKFHLMKLHQNATECNRMQQSATECNRMQQNACSEGSQLPASRSQPVSSRTPDTASFVHSYQRVAHNQCLLVHPTQRHLFTATSESLTTSVFSYTRHSVICSQLPASRSQPVSSRTPDTASFVHSYQRVAHNQCLLVHPTQRHLFTATSEWLTTSVFSYTRHSVICSQLPASRSQPVSSRTPDTASFVHSYQRVAHNQCLRVHPTQRHLFTATSESLTTSVFSYTRHSVICSQLPASRSQPVSSRTPDTASFVHSYQRVAHNQCLRVHPTQRHLFTATSEWLTTSVFSYTRHSVICSQTLGTCTERHYTGK